MSAPSTKSLPPHVIEALAHDRLDLLAPDERARIAALREDPHESARLEGMIEREREESMAFSRALPRASDDVDVDFLVRSAMARAEQHAEHASTRTLAIGGALGLIFAAVSGALAMLSTDESVLEPVRRAFALARVGLTVSLATSRALDDVPGGAPTVALALLALVSGLVWLARRFDAPFRAALPLLMVLAVMPTTARAYDLEGVLPDARVHVDVDHVPLSAALTQAARSAGLGVVYTLPTDPEVTLHADDVPLADVLAALLPGHASMITVVGRVLQVHESPAAVAPAASTTSATGSAPSTAPSAGPSVTVPAIPTPPAPPPLPAAPVGAPPAPARSVELHDVVTFGGDAHVAPAQEVRDVVTMGGDATIEGRTYGSVVTMGGDADISGVVVGDVVTMGGDIHVRQNGRVHGRLDSLGGEVQVDSPAAPAPSVAPGMPSAPALAIPPMPPPSYQHNESDGGVVWAVLRYSLLFLAALLFLAFAPERLGRVQRAMVERPVRTLATGVLVMLAGGVAIVALFVSLVGIPVALVLSVAAPLFMALGLASVVPVVGGMIPTKYFEGRPVARLAAGAFVLFVVTRIPLIGGLALTIALFAGLGGLVLTRIGARDAEG